MENQENLINEVKEVKEETSLASVQSFGVMKQTSKTKQDIFTNITDQKKIFNLENNVDEKLNNCKGEKLRIVDVLIKRIEKPLDEPELNPETGEIIRDREIKMITILIDDTGKSYVTASKSFAFQMINYINMFGIENIEKGLEIKITDKAVKNSSNRALAFELV